MFRLVKILNAGQNQPEPITLPCTAGENITYGEALTLSAGALTKCGATVRPTFMAGADRPSDSAVTAIPAYPVSPDMIFECRVNESPASLHAGSIVTINTDADGVTATTTSGVATVYHMSGATAAGDYLLVSFM